MRKIGALLSLTLVIASCSSVPTARAPMVSGMYLGVSTFNNQLSSTPIKLNNVTDAVKFIQAAKQGNGTVLYYSVDQALNTIQNGNLPQDITHGALVVFTDGLDLGSYALTDGKYPSGEQYLKGLQKRIQTMRLANGAALDVYVIGVIGKDVSDQTSFRDTLSGLASKKDNVHQISEIRELDATFSSILKSLTTVTTSTTLNLTIPAVEPNQKVRFTFDATGKENAAESKLYIEGTFTVNQKLFSLENLEYEGVGSTSGAKVRHSAMQGNNLTFAFRDLTLGSGLEVGNIREWILQNGKWQINSEFKPIENTNTEVRQTSAVVYLVLDSSSSLGSDFEAVKKAASDFVYTLYNTDPQKMYEQRYATYEISDKNNALSEVLIFDYETRRVANCFYGEGRVLFVKNVSSLEWNGKSFSFFPDAGARGYVEYPTDLTIKVTSVNSATNTLTAIVIYNKVKNLPNMSW